MTLFDQIQEARKFIKGLSPVTPEVGVVLGSGLGDFADTLEEKVLIPYGDIPHFKKSTVKGHAGRLVTGKIKGRPGAVMQGRYHYYEGHDIHDVVFPVRVLAALGCKAILLTNAAGGINPMLIPGDLMILRDHINMMGVNPLRGDNDERLGTRFPDMSAVYDEELVEIIAEGMAGQGMGVKKGVYVAVSGPSYETPAEIRMLKTIGADAVGMSTVPEAVAARHMGTRIAGISCITNFAAGLSHRNLSHEEVVETSNRVKPKFIRLLQDILPRF